MAMMDDEPVAKPQGLGSRPLDDLSIDELEDYVSQLLDEIERTKAVIARKQDHKASVAGLFKT